MVFKDLKAKREARKEQKEKKQQLTEEIAQERAAIEEAVQVLEATMELHQQEHAPKWAYLQVVDIEEDLLKTLGACGWELVSTSSAPQTKFTLGGPENVWHVLYIFKRPLRPEKADFDVLRDQIAARRDFVAGLERQLWQIEQDLLQLI